VDEGSDRADQAYSLNVNVKGILFDYDGTLADTMEGHYLAWKAAVGEYGVSIDAQDYYPLTKEEVLTKGWKWRDQTDEVPQVSKVIDASQLPDSIADIPDEVLDWAIRCEATGPSGFRKRN